MPLFRLMLRAFGVGAQVCAGGSIESLAREGNRLGARCGVGGVINAQYLRYLAHLMGYGTLRALIF